jgi:L-ascorbate metabolism protein UlaG (beta-lactamase superfamily)
MLIQWFGHASFRIEMGSCTIITDPFNAELGYPMFPREADIVTISHQHWDHNASETVSGTPQILAHPGLYQLNEVMIQGFQSYHDKQAGRERGVNTIFKIEAEAITLLHLGDLGHMISQSLAEEIGTIDILLLPVGGKYTVGADEAYEIVRLLQPRVVIPMHYQTPPLSFVLAPVEAFTSKFERVLKLPGLEISQPELPTETEIIILDYLLG